MMKLIEFREEEYDKIMEKARGAHMTVKEIKEFLYELFMALCEYDIKGYEYDEDDEEFDEYNYKHVDPVASLLKKSKLGLHKGVKSGLHKSHIGRYAY